MNPCDFKGQTPCYLINEELFEQNMSAFSEALQTYWPNYIISYSVKTNPLPWILGKVRQAGHYAEVVSDTEYTLAKRIGFSDQSIIWNGPIKGHDLFLNALKNKCIVNIDSQRELEWLKEANELFDEIHVGLRINFDLEAHCPEESLTQGEGNRFGFNVENGTFASVLSDLSVLKNVHICGVHMHTNSKTRSLAVFRALSQKTIELAKDFHLKLSYIDIGGSFFVKKYDFQAYTQYAHAISEVLSSYFCPEDTTLIVEPGSALISTPVSYLTSVLDVKDTHRDRFVVTDGTRLHIDAFMRKTSYVYDCFSPDGNVLSHTQHNKQIVCGYSCMETDRIMTIENRPELQAGDYIQYDMTGGYTTTFNAFFIEFMPNVFVLHKDGSHTLVRKKWGVDEFLQNCFFE